MVATSKLTSEQVELLAGRSNIYPSRKSFSKISAFLVEFCFLDGQSTRNARVLFQRHVKVQFGDLC
jgi:hypothetical protein